MPELVRISRWQHRAACKTCGYALRHLTTNICPECGNGFDPHNPETMSVSAWVNWIDQVLLNPPGAISHVVCAIPLLLAIAASVDVMSNGDVLGFSVLGLLIVPFYWCVRLVTWLALRSHYGRHHTASRHALHWLVTPATSMLTVILWISEF